jgi:hypothetical protein
MTIGQPSAPDPSPGSALEARRLAHRTRRMTFVIACLRDRQAVYEHAGDVPRPLRDTMPWTELTHPRARARGATRST